jgi:DNA repair protein RadC
MTHLKIRDLLKSEKPREKLIDLGSGQLADIELLAIVIGTGGKDESALDVSRNLINNFGGLKEIISADIGELTSFKNIGASKAAAIKAAGEIGIRANTAQVKEHLEIKKPQDVYDLIKKDIYGKNKENLYLISLNTRNRVISKDLISTGTLNETLIHPREIYREAFLRNAVSVILVHNHPSNDPTPSDEDIKVTQRIARAGAEIGIALVDHVIACDGGFISMKSLNIINHKINMKGGEKEKDEQI